MSAFDWLPCPFCGEAPRYRTRKAESLWSHEFVDWHEVSCGNCEIEMRRCDDVDDLRDAWNQRSDGEPVERCHRCHKPIACESDFDAYGEHTWNCDCDPCRARCWGHTNCHLIAPPATLADERTAGELVTANARRARFKESHDRVLATHAETFRALAASALAAADARQDEDVDAWAATLAADSCAAGEAETSPDWRPCPDCAHVRSVDAALASEQRIHAAALGVVEAARVVVGFADCEDVDCDCGIGRLRSVLAAYEEAGR